MARALLFALLVLLGLAAAAAAEEHPRLALPIDCALGQDCAILQYPDLDPGAGAVDHACGPLSYDSHSGTDFYLLRLGLMGQGVPVLAAAPGRVKAVRDGMADVSVLAAGRDAILDRRAGNSVVIDHGGGWESQYAHLRQGSVSARPGDRVEAEDRLGLVGLSGDIALPHLHFTLRKDGTTYDPFTGRPLDAGCDAGASGFWAADAREALAYLETGPWDAGFATEAPDTTEAKTGAYSEIDFDQGAPALVFWAYAWGVQPGDRETIRLLGPEGEILAEASETLTDRRLLRFKFAGRKRPDTGWPSGTYRGEYSLARDGKTLFTTVRDLRRN